MPVGKPVQVRLQEDELRALDEYRRARANPPTRGGAGRELICSALSLDAPGDKDAPHNAENAA
jgi:hypothetical protein